MPRLDATSKSEAKPRRSQLSDRSRVRSTKTPPTDPFYRTGTPKRTESTSKASEEALLIATWQAISDLSFLKHLPFGLSLDEQATVSILISMEPDLRSPNMRSRKEAHPASRRLQVRTPLKPIQKSNKNSHLTYAVRTPYPQTSPENWCILLPW